MTVSTQTTCTKTFAFLVVLVFKLLSHKILFVNRKTMETVKKISYFFKKIANFTYKLLQNYK